MADDQKKESSVQTGPSAAQQAQSKAYDALPEQLAIRLKKNGAIAGMALLGGDEIDASGITDAQYLQIANDLIKNRTAEFETKTPSGTAFKVKLTIKEMDENLELLGKDPATKDKYDKIIKDLGANSFDQAIPDEARRVKIAKAVGNAVEENTGNLPFLGGASFMNALMGFLKWIFSPHDESIASYITKETANGIAASTEKNLAGANIGLSQDTIKEISTGVRTRILKEKGFPDKDAPEPETLANTKGAEPKKEPPKEATPATEVTTPATTKPQAPSVSPPPPPPIPTHRPSVDPVEAGAAITTAGAAAAFLKYLEEQRGTGQQTTQSPAGGNGSINVVSIPAAGQRTTEKPTAKPYDPKTPPALPDYITLPGGNSDDSKHLPGNSTPPAEQTPTKDSTAPRTVIRTPAPVVTTPIIVAPRVPSVPKTDVSGLDKKGLPHKEEPQKIITEPHTAAPATTTPKPESAPTAPARLESQTQTPAPVPKQPSHMERTIGDIATTLLAKDNIPNKPELIRDLTTFLAKNSKDINFKNPKESIKIILEKAFDPTSKDPANIKLAQNIRDYSHAKQKQSFIGSKFDPVNDDTIKTELVKSLTTAIRENKVALETAMTNDAAQQEGKKLQKAGLSNDGPAPYVSAKRPQNPEAQLAYS